MYGEGGFATEGGFDGLGTLKQVAGHAQRAQGAEDEAQVEHGAGDGSAAGQAGLLASPGREGSGRALADARKNGLTPPLWVLLRLKAQVRQRMEHLYRPRGLASLSR